MAGRNALSSMLDSGSQELEPELCIWAGTSFPLDELTGESKGRMVRGLLQAVVRREPEVATELIAGLHDQLLTVARELRMPSASERTHQIRAAVYPLLAAIVS